MLARGREPPRFVAVAIVLATIELARGARVIGVAKKQDAVELALTSQRPPSTAGNGDGEVAWDDIIAGCRRHESAMQRELHDRSREQLFRLAVRMVGRQDAADVCQQIYLKIFQSIDQFAGRANAMTWLYRIAVNECLQHRRRRARRPVINLADYEPPEQSKAFTAREAEHDLLETALGRIDPELRCIFLLREIEELSYAEIAHAMQLAEGTVASRLSRARRQLQEELMIRGWGAAAV
jgi:RNA polymerase sigma-70 factor (ECF subfamily)